MESIWGLHGERELRGCPLRLAGLPCGCRRQGLVHELGRTHVARRAQFRADPHDRSRRPCCAALDIRGAPIMPSLCILRAVQLSGRRQRCSSFPVTIPTAAARRCRQWIGRGSTTKSDTGRRYAGTRSRPQSSLRSTTPPPHRPLRQMIASAARRAPTFQPSRNSSTDRRPTVRRAIHVQPTRRNPTRQIHDRRQQRCMPTVCLCRDHPSGGRNEGNDGISQDVV